MDWNPPAALPLNLRSHLGRFDIGSDDLVIIEGLPEGADLTVGMCKPDGSWSVRSIEIDNAAFVPLYENGETYALQVCLLAPDPSDHGLPKMKGKVQFSLAVPLAALPVLEEFEDLVPKRSGSAANTVILLPADPALMEASAAAPPTVTAAPQPKRGTNAPVPAAERAPAAAADFDNHFAALRMEWQSTVKKQVAAAEKRLKATHLQQLSKIQAVLAQEEAERTTATAAEWKAELTRRAAGAEAELKARAKEHLADLASRLHGKSGGVAAAETPADFEKRLATAETAWRKAEAERLAAAEMAWSKRETERLAALEAKWRAEHDMRLGAVLANLEIMAKGQLDISQPLPAAERASAASTLHRASPEAHDDDNRWNNNTAAA